MKPNRIYSYLFLFLLITYIGLTFFLPPDPILHTQYHLTNAGIFAVNLSLVLPITIIWLMAYYGATRVKHYALLISKTTEGRPLQTVANGLLWLVLSSPLTSIVSALLKYLSRVHPGLQPSSRIVTNYVTIIVNLVAIILIARGAEQLTMLVKKKPSLKEQHMWVVGFIVLAIIYCWLLIVQRAPHDQYVLPNWLLLLTIALPYLYVWYRGLQAAVHLYYYKHKVKGTLYRQAMQYLAKGLGAVIFISVLIQLLTTASLRLNRLNLTPLLVIVYCLLVLLAIAYALIAMGANRLKKIEEV